MIALLKAGADPSRMSCWGVWGILRPSRRSPWASSSDFPDEVTEGFNALHSLCGVTREMDYLQATEIMNEPYVLQECMDLMLQSNIGIDARMSKGSHPLLRVDVVTHTNAHAARCWC